MADASVRPARADDAAEVARIQLSTWRTAYADIVPAEVLTELGDELVAGQWESAITAPPTGRHRVLVATEGEHTVGFVAFGPADEDDRMAAPDSEVSDVELLGVATLLVEPRWGRRGHGSRLLAATVEHARADGFTAAVTWVLDGDAASAAFFGSAGWGADGLGRILEMADETVHEGRYATDLTEEPPAS